MSLTSGVKLGPYEIVSPIGSGGMGEVYRARDTRLDRTVAIKILPSHLASNPDLKQRFEREARTISSLSHPHICSLYDIGHQDDMDYLVMEFLEGETLASRLTKGALSTEQVLRYGIQTADALDKAHKQGIIHRDLKPGNIMITKSGAKLLDFGLAKLEAVATQPLVSGVSKLATEQRDLTAEGTILGTIQYMSPEQLEGKDTDSRTDIFALGTVLYEMATGKKAFTGKSQASLIAAILSSEPQPISHIQPMIPPALDRVVKTCMAKDPDERWQTAHDVMLELKWIAEGGSQAGIPATVVSRRKSREKLAWSLAILLAITVFILFYYIYHNRRQDHLVRFTISPPEGGSFVTAEISSAPGISNMMAISPDGQQLTFLASATGARPMLWLRSLNSAEAKRLPGTEGATFPFWSPDNRSIGFFADGKLKTIRIAEPVPQTLCDAPAARGGSWNQDGVILFAPDILTPLYRVSAYGGIPKQVTTLEKETEESHRWPHFLPDGRHYLYFANSGIDQNDAIYVGSLDSEERQKLFAGDSSVLYASGYLFFIRDPSLMIQKFDPKKLELSGEPVRLVENVGRSGETGPTGYSPFSVSQNGILAYGNLQLVNTQLVWFDQKGNELQRIGTPSVYFEPSISRDGKRIAVGLGPNTSKQDIWIMELSRATFSRLTFENSNVGTPFWSPDGSKIAFSSKQLGHADLYWKPATGAGNKELLYKNDHDKWLDCWSPDGRYLIFEEPDPKLKFDLWMLPLVEGRKPIPILRTEFNETHAQVSPDGQWIAYASDESGRAEVFVRPFPSLQQGKWQISTEGGDQPFWRGDGKELYYLNSDKKLVSVAVNTLSGFESGSPATLFQTHVQVSNLTGFRNHFIASPNGKRFLVSSITITQTSSPITVVVNWMADLNR